MSAENSENRSIKDVPLDQKGPWSGRLVMRVLGPSIDDDYHSKNKPIGRVLDPHELLQNAGPLRCVPWSTTRREKQETKNDMQPGVANDFVKVEPNHALVDNDNVVVLFDLYLFESCNGKVLEVHQIHMNRKSNEDMDRVMKRLEISVVKKIKRGVPKQSKKQKRKNNKHSHADTSSAMWIRSRNAETANCTSHLEAYTLWNTSGIPNAAVWKRVVENLDEVAISVCVASENATIPIELDVCPPTLVAVKTFENFEASVFVGVPLVVDCRVMYATHSVVDWYVGGIKVCTASPCYTPVPNDVGKEVAVLVTPSHKGKSHDGHGCEEAYRFKNPVEPLPHMPILSPLRNSWIHCRNPSAPSNALRIVTYNVLADQNAYPRDSSAPNLYPYCDLKFLARSRRMPMVVHEILAYQADVVCLQEVDMLVFESIFQPVLTAMGYQGYYSVKKTGSTREGCAMFWSLDCFERVSREEMKTHVIRDLFPQPKSGAAAATPGNCNTHGATWESMDAIADLLYRYDNLRDVVQNKLGHVLQVTTLTLKNKGHTEQGNKIPEKIVLANTHLFFHPDAGHIRVMQLLVSCQLLDTVRKENNQKYPFVYCGDFNATSDSGTCQLMYERLVSPDNDRGEIWKHLETFVWEKDLRMASLPRANDNSLIPTLSLPPDFPRLCSGWGGMIPDFTHYIVGFQETLDHVLVSEPSETETYGFQPNKWAPMPTEQDITKFVAMPNEFMPSDHISVVCDVEFKSN